MGVVAFAALIGMLSGCSGAGGQYVWVDDYAPARTAPAAGYLLGPGDLVNVQVWESDKLSTRERVRADGKIAMPLLGEIEVANKAPQEVARELERQLREQNIVLAPRVSVVVEESRPLTVSVLGAVTRNGTFQLEPGAGVAEALASAGGLTEFAHKDRIFVVRRGPPAVRIRFTFEQLTDDLGHAATFRLQPGDLVVAE